MSNLKRWMRKKKKGPLKLSRELGFDTWQFWSIFAHIRKPLITEATRISHWTLGQVRIEDLYSDYEEAVKKRLAKN